MSDKKIEDMYDELISLTINNPKHFTFISYVKAYVNHLVYISGLANRLWDVKDVNIYRKSVEQVGRYYSKNMIPPSSR